MNVKMDIREIIEKARRTFIKRSDLDDILLAPIKIVYFGGISKKLEPEKTEIKENVIYENTNRFLIYPEEPNHIILPIFYGHFASGIIYENSETLASLSDAYIEIIGDGFGDTSKLLAETAYKKAKELEIPTKILIKEKRIANHSKHASNFLRKIPEDLKEKYKDHSDVAYKAEHFLREVFEEEDN